MRKLGWLVVSLTLLGSGAYVGLYLARWEWNRAIFMAMVFVAAEVALAAALVMRKVARAQRDLLSALSPARRPRPGDADGEVLARLRSNRPERDRFAWLDPTRGRTNVFITMLVGGGVVVSGAAWVIDRIAGRTATATMEERLARRLEPLRLPPGGLVADDAALLAQEVPDGDADPDLRLLLAPAPRHHPPSRLGSG